MSVSSAPVVEPYKKVEIRPEVKCEEDLDIVLSLPDFEGKEDTYMSWRRAAHDAYEIFKDYDGSPKHYQAVAIIRNKIKGSASRLLASANIVLNFKAIIDRLDLKYTDQRPIYLLELELSVLRQGSMSLMEYYEQVEQKLASLTNKTILRYQSDVAAVFNAKYRADALFVFISGARKILRNVLLSARLKDLPSALALALEVEANNERYASAEGLQRESREIKLGTSRNYK